jgi:hypothetical protein
VKIQGNLPLTPEALRRLSIGEPSSVDVVLAQGSLTATGGLRRRHGKSLTDQRGVGSSGRIRTENQRSTRDDSDLLDPDLNPT